MKFNFYVEKKENGIRLQAGKEVRQGTKKEEG